MKESFIVNGKQI